MFQLREWVTPLLFPLSPASAGNSQWAESARVNVGERAGLVDKPRSSAQREGLHIDPTHTTDDDYSARLLQTAPLHYTVRRSLEGDFRHTSLTGFIVCWRLSRSKPASWAPRLADKERRAPSSPTCAITHILERYTHSRPASVTQNRDCYRHHDVKLRRTQGAERVAIPGKFEHDPVTAGRHRAE